MTFVTLSDLNATISPIANIIKTINVITSKL